MQKSSFFNSVNGDRKYNASDYATYFGSFIGNGVYSNPGNNLAVTAVSGMNISVTPGKAWINGYYYENTDAFNMSIDPADGALKRIDRIVLRLDHLNRQIVLSVLKGTPAGTPTAPTLTRNADIYELGIADILINNGDTGVLLAQITDLRFNSALCGIVSGVVNQIDTTGLFAQYDAEFNDWFEQAQNTLSGDVAGNLLNQINTHKSENALHVPHLGVTINSGNNYSITNTEVIDDRDKFSVEFNSTASGTATLKISSIGSAYTLKKPDGTDFKPKSGGIYSFIRKGTVFQLLGEGGDYGAAAQNDVKVGITFGTETGVQIGTYTSDSTATAADISSGKIAYANGQRLIGTSTKKNWVTGSMPNAVIGNLTVTITLNFVPSIIKLAYKQYDNTHTTILSQGTIMYDNTLGLNYAPAAGTIDANAFTVTKLSPTQFRFFATGYTGEYWENITWLAYEQ